MRLRLGWLVVAAGTACDGTLLLDAPPAGDLSADAPAAAAPKQIGGAGAMVKLHSAVGQVRAATFAPGPSTGGSTPVVVPDFINVAPTSNYAGLYRGAGGNRIAFSNVGNTSADVQALDESGHVLWTHTLGIGGLKSGFDFNGDGVIDFALVKAAAWSSCNADVLYARTVDVYSGLDGALLSSVTLNDTCILINNSFWQRSITLAENTIQFGPTSGLLTLAPRYYGQGWMMGPGFSYAFYTPDTAAYDTYSSSAPALQPSAGGTPHVSMAQPLHGLIVPYGGGARYVAFSSGRVAQYAVADLSPGQLLVDTPFLSSTALVGRSYGLVQHDAKGNPSRVSVISGTSIRDLYFDVDASDATGVVYGHDVWGAIERHVTTYDLSSKAVDQKAISYAHTNQNEYAYINRLAYPANAYLPSSNTAGSRLVYDVFDGATWSIHISTPGGSASQSIWANQIVWDVIRRSDDEVDLVTSPVDSRQIMVPDYVSDVGAPLSWRAATYFPAWRTEIYRWTRASEQAALVKTLEGMIPYLGVEVSSPGDAAAADGVISPTLRAMDRATHSKPVMIMRTQTGTYPEVPIDW